MACSSGQCWTNGCTGPCSASCTACANWCSSSCTGGCGGCSGCTSCTGTCEGCTSCSGTCSGECTSCSGTCSGECTTACTSSCKNLCNTGCETSEATRIYTNLTLSTKFEKTNIQDIADLIFYEASRRPGTSPVDINFSVGSLITAAQMKIILNNLTASNQSVAYTAKQGESATAKFGNDLISKGKTAYKQEVLLS